MNKPFVLPSPEVCEHTARQYEAALGSGTQEYDMEWHAHLRILSRVNPGWDS